MSEAFAYDLTVPVAEIRKTYRYDITCQGTVPSAIGCALEARSFEEAVRLAVSLGGDADTQAAIAGSIAEARFGLPRAIVRRTLGYFDDDLRAVVARFCRRYVKKGLARLFGV